MPTGVPSILVAALAVGAMAVGCADETDGMRDRAPTAGSTAGSSSVSTSGSAAAPVYVADGGNLGTNLGGVNYWDGVVPFADLMDQAGDWVPQADGADWGQGAPLRFDAHGWPKDLQPGQYASVVLAEVSYPAGTYSVRWEGTGTFDVNGTTFGGGTSGGTGSVDLDGSESVVLNLRSTDADDPIHTIDVRVPGEAEDAVFRGDYLDAERIYRAVRFMDWQRTNSLLGDPDRTFTCDARVDDQYYSQGSALGASVERMVDLANALHADPWFNIPHEATDDWVTCHAEVVAGRLDPGLTPRYEFSNETWNPVFRAYHDLAAEAARLGLGADDFEGVQLRTGERHVRVMGLVRAVFDRTDRSVIAVIAGQAANSWVVERRLSVDGGRDATDEIAIAPYMMLADDLYDPAVAAEVATAGTDEVLLRLAATLDADVTAWIADHVRLASELGVPLVAYEGGQHLVGDSSDDLLTDVLTTANRDPRMGDLYRRYLDAWADATGNALIMHFTDIGPATRFGSWGALETISTTSPKYAALSAFAATPRP